MAIPSRQMMRLLSPRLQILQPRPSPIFQQVRHVSSRYSNPSKRAVAAQTAASDSQPLEYVSGGFPTGTARNPLDARANHLAWERKRQYHLRRMRLAGMGLLLTFGTLTLVLYSIDLDALEKSHKKKREATQLDASEEANAMFQGKEVHVVGAGEGKRIVAHGNGEDIELVETGTSSVPHFPRTIYLPALTSSTALPGPGTNRADQPDAALGMGTMNNQEEYTLIGLGIRTVMWIQVYVVGMYIRTKDIRTLQEKLIHEINPTASTLIPSEKEMLKTILLDPEKSRQMWTELLQVPGVKTAFRISPTRNTDFGHLRDGFVNGINARKAEARKLANGGETEFDAEDFGNAVQDLKSVFAGGKAPKGSILILQRDTDGALNVLYQSKPESKKSDLGTLGSVKDERVARLIWLGYLAGEKVSSKSARDGVVDGCIAFAARPIGSVETRVT